ncbi:MAG TPA: TIR domain-containing protein [Pyrinomonadaceae bacterium]|jgi:hypothetical protein
MEKKKILFVNIDSNADTLNPDKKAQEINKLFSQTRLGDKFELKYCSAAQIEDLRRALLEDTPHIVHFSSHSLGIQDPAMAETLLNLFKPFKEKVECVLLNASYTGSLAAELSAGIPYVVGMEGVIKEEAVLQFASEFYKALGTGWIIQEAFKFARTSKNLSDLDAERAPTLYVHKQTVSLPETAKKPVDNKEDAVKIFISYVDRDEQLRQELEYQLESLQRQGIISTWHDRKMELAEEREAVILKNLNEAQIILLLVSARFIASDKYNIEVERAMQRRRTEGVRVIPIILRACDWRLTSFGGLQPLPRNEIPVSRWDDMEEAFYNVALELKEIIRRMNQ